MMCLRLAASLATLATGALATPFSAPAYDARWTIAPPSMRAYDEVRGVGCVTGSAGLALRAGVRAELLFNGTQLQVFGTAAPVGTQILVDGETLPLHLDTLDATACVPCAEWEGFIGGHNLTISRMWVRMDCLAPDCGRHSHESTTGHTFPLCASCQFAMYCSRACQKRDWERAGTPHREICDILREVFTFAFMDMDDDQFVDACHENNFPVSRAIRLTDWMAGVPYRSCI